MTRSDDDADDVGQPASHGPNMAPNVAQSASVFDLCCYRSLYERLRLLGVVHAWTLASGRPEAPVDEHDQSRARPRDTGIQPAEVTGIIHPGSVHAT